MYTLTWDNGNLLGNFICTIVTRKQFIAEFHLHRAYSPVKYSICCINILCKCKCAIFVIVTVTTTKCTRRNFQMVVFPDLYRTIRIYGTYECYIRTFCKCPFATEVVCRCKSNCTCKLFRNKLEYSFEYVFRTNTIISINVDICLMDKFKWRKCYAWRVHTYFF